MIIGLSGNIGAGKTTFGERLAREIRQLCPSAVVTLYGEYFLETKAWAIYCADPSKAGMFQVVVAKLRSDLMHSLRRGPADPLRFDIVDRASVRDDNIFAAAQREIGNIDQDEYDMYECACGPARAVPLPPEPDRIYYITTDKDTCLENMVSRSRPGEKPDLKYLALLDRLHAEYMPETAVRLDWEPDMWKHTAKRVAAELVDCARGHPGCG